MMPVPGAPIAPVLAVRTKSQLPLPADANDTLTRPKEGGSPVPAVAFRLPAPVFTMTWVGPPSTTGPPTLAKFNVIAWPRGLVLLPAVTSWLARPVEAERLYAILADEPVDPVNKPVVVSVLAVGVAPPVRSMVPPARLLKAPANVDVVPIAVTNPLLLVAMSPIVPFAREIVPPELLFSV